MNEYLSIMVWGEQRASLAGNVITKDFGQWFNNWGIVKNIAKGEGDANFVASWPGPVYPPDIGQLSARSFL